MSKNNSEEIIECIYQELNMGGYGFNPREAHRLLLFIRKQFEEYASQPQSNSDAVEFAEWKEQNNYWMDEFEEDGITRLDGMRWSNDSVNPQYYTTNQLYQIFLKEKHGITQ